MKNSKDLYQGLLTSKQGLQNLKHQVYRALRVPQVLTVYRALRDLKAQQELTAQTVLMEQTAHKDHKDLKVQLAQTEVTA